jgi:hypothetical protein
MYTELRRETLHDFLRDVCSTRALANRADVDVDRFATLLTGMFRNPADFMLGCWQYSLSLQQQVWERSFLPSAETPSTLSLVEWSETVRKGMAPFLQLFEAPPRAQEATAGTVGEIHGSLERGPGTDA